MLVIAGLVVGLSGWIGASFLYYSSHPKTFYHLSLSAIGRRVPSLAWLARRSLGLTDPFYLIYVKGGRDKETVEVSPEQIETLKSATEKVITKTPFSSLEARYFQSVKGLLEKDTPWIPSEKKGAVSWLEATALLQQVRKQARVIQIELQKEWVSVFISVREVPSGKHWEMVFVNEVLYPTVIDSISLKADPTSGFVLTDLATERRRAEFKLEDNLFILSDQFGLGLEAYVLRGDVDQIVEFKMTLRNQMTGRLFEPRAIRFIDYTES